ncbi:MAG: cation:proton antiporter, partial [Candidatus Cryptobacteroides sp.]
MNEEISFARDLAVILISAGIFTIISKALKQPSVLGYIVAGVLIGPSIGFYYGISSTEAVHQWSEIGIIFLMFGLGLEFSFKKLLSVGSSVLITAVSKFLGVFLLGFLTGMAMSWSSMESIFLGGLLSMSSTTVIIKSFDEMGLKHKPYSQIVFGTIIIEDLIAILMMVLLSSLAVSNRFEGAQMLFNLGKLAFFLILWFLVGIYLIPTLLKKASKYLNDEILLIVGIGLCFTMVTLAEGVGFSSALGAFVMGSILAETIQSERIGRLLNPIKDLFGAVFFVSVGMMLSPSVIVEHWAMVLVITLLVFVADVLFVTIGVVISGKGLENAVHSGFSLAQLGEFGFIIAGVGCSLGVMRDFIYPVIIAVSVITTFTAPYMIRLAGPAYRLLKRVLPQKVLDRIDREERPVATVSGQNKWRQVLKAYFLRVILYGVVIIAIDIAGKAYLNTLLLKVFPSMGESLLKWVELSVTLLLVSPFIYGMAASTGSSSQVLALLKEDRKNALP